MSQKVVILRPQEHPNGTHKPFLCITVIGGQ
jgi:hypothetical protein